MNREIKFRVWNTILNKMYNDGWHGRCQGENGTNTTNDHLRFLQESGMVLMQYTGLKDKNGVEIYEGDVVSRVGGGLLGNPDKVLFTGEVVFTEHGYKAKYESDEPGTAGHLRDTSYGNLFNEGELEVIGNIWENPELLKENR